MRRTGLFYSTIGGLIFLAFAAAAWQLWGFAFPFVFGGLLISATLFLIGVAGAADIGHRESNQVKAGGSDD